MGDRNIRGMTKGPSAPRVSRESRILLLTVVVCAAVLLLLARLRFPEVPPAVDTTAPPLERLAARASYDALAADIQRVEPMVAPNVVVLRIARQLPSAPHDIRGLLARLESRVDLRHVAALRIGAEAAVAVIDTAAHVDGVVGTVGEGTATIVASDPVRGLARIRVPAAPVRSLARLPLASLVTPAYVVAVEGTQAGATLRPVFLGRGDRFRSARWPQPLLPLGGIAAPAGALMFSLAGEFIGSVVMEDGAAALVGASDLFDIGERLASTASAPSDLGIAVQPLTPSLMAALAVQRGVVVAEVAHDGPAADQLAPGDVIAGVDDWSTDSPDELLLRLASRPAGERVTLTVVRHGESRQVTLPLVPAALDSPVDRTVGLVWQRGAGTRVEPGTDAAVPGLQPGDLITRAGTTAAPTPAQLRRLLAATTPSGFATLIVRRADRQVVVAVPVAGRTDAATR